MLMNTDHDNVDNTYTDATTKDTKEKERNGKGKDAGEVRPERSYRPIKESRKVCLFARRKRVRKKQPYLHGCRCRMLSPGSGIQWCPDKEDQNEFVSPKETKRANVNNFISSELGSWLWYFGKREP